MNEIDSWSYQLTKALTTPWAETLKFNESPLLPAAAKSAAVQTTNEWSKLNWIQILTSLSYK